MSFAKTMKVINSCTTEDQVSLALKYARLECRNLDPLLGCFVMDAFILAARKIREDIKLKDTIRAEVNAALDKRGLTEI